MTETNDTDHDQSEPETDQETPQNRDERGENVSEVRVEPDHQTGADITSGYEHADEFDADAGMRDDFEQDAEVNFEHGPAQTTDPGAVDYEQPDDAAIADDAEVARLYPHGIDLELPDGLESFDPAPWDEDRRERIRELLTSDLPRGYHVRAYPNAVTGEIHEVLAVPAEGRVLDSPRVVPKRAGTGNFFKPTLSPRERAVLYEVRFDPDEFVTDRDMVEYERAVREEHAERVAGLTGISDVLELPPDSYETYWAAGTLEARREADE